MYLRFLIHLILLCSANPPYSFANKIAFSGQRKQLKHFDSSFTCSYRFVKSVAYARGRERQCGGQPSTSYPSLTIGKIRKPLFLERSAFFVQGLCFSVLYPTCLCNLEKLLL